MTRNSYHTSLKELVHHGLIPEQYIKKLPKANLSRWRNDDFSRFVGSEINQIAEKHTDLIQTLNEYPKMFHAYGKLVQSMIAISSKTKEFKRVIRDSKEQVVDAINQVRGIIPIEKAARVFNISKGTFHAWVIDTKIKCGVSYFKQCLKAYPTQITPHEIKQIRKALINPKTKHWSMKGVYWKGIREGELSVSLKTLYKINRILEIRKTRGKSKNKKKYKKGIRATAPNRIWHTDITFVKTADGNKYPVYLLIDNYSRSLLAYDVQEKVMGKITSKLIDTAYTKARKVSKELNVNLIVDGGAENNNIYVENFIAQSEINIQKKIALKDLPFSNSMVERVNQTLKYQYLFPKQIRDFKHLKRSLRYFAEDYDKRRPHGSLNGLTPHEAWLGMEFDQSIRTNVLKNARTNRLEYNKLNKCSICE